MSDATQPLSFKSLFDEARQEFGSPDRGFFRTAWLMLRAPGPTLRAVFRGEATELTRPVRFFLLVFSLYALVYVSTGAMAVLADDTARHLAETLNQAQAVQGHASRIDATQIAGLNPLYYYLQSPLITELVIAVFFWLASWPALARMGLSGTERIVATLYLYSTFNLVQVPLVVFVFLGQSSLLATTLGFLFVAYLAWATHGLSAPTGRWGFLRGIAWYIALQAISAVLFGALTLKTLYDMERSGAWTPAASASR